MFGSYNLHNVAPSRGLLKQRSKYLGILRHKVRPKLQVVSLKPIEFFSRSSFFQFNQTNFFQSVHRCQMMWLSCKIVFEKCKLCIPPSSQTYSIFDFKIIFNSSFLKRKLRNSLCFNNTYEIHMFAWLILLLFKSLAGQPSRKVTSNLQKYAPSCF